MRTVSLSLIPIFCATIFFGPGLLAQSCPHDNVYQAAPVEDILHATNSDAVYRYAAISGEIIAPALQRLTKTGMKVDSVAGAAQVSLARLGDKNALVQLDAELNDRSKSYLAIPKLVRVGTDQSVSILMDFLRAHVSDDSLRHDFGDYITDVRGDLVEGLIEQWQIGPALPSGLLSVDFRDWPTWWDQNKSKRVVVSISENFHDPYLKCLARKVEWGFPDAIFDMTQTRDPQVMSVLKQLARWGNPKRRPFNVRMLQGRAQLGLLQLGDGDELQTVKRELNLSGYSSAIDELQLMGGPLAVRSLIEALDSPDFFPQYSQSPNYDRIRFEHNELISSALATLVAHPPDVKSPAESKKTWEDWWTRNHTGPYTKQPTKTYE